MSPRARMEYLEAIYLRYPKASLKEKTIILNEFCLNSGYHRKHAIRLLNHFKRFTKPKPKKRGKPSKEAALSDLQIGPSGCFPTEFVRQARSGAPGAMTFPKERGSGFRSGAFVYSSR